MKKTEKTGAEILKDFREVLLKASWRPGPDLVSPIRTVCEVPGYGPVQAEWYQSVGSRSYQVLTLRYQEAGEVKTANIYDHEAHVEMCEIKRRVQAEVEKPVPVKQMHRIRDPHIFLPV